MMTGKEMLSFLFGVTVAAGVASGATLMSVKYMEEQKKPKTPAEVIDKIYKDKRLSKFAKLSFDPVSRCRDYLEATRGKSVLTAKYDERSSKYDSDTAEYTVFMDVELDDSSIFSGAGTGMYIMRCVVSENDKKIKEYFLASEEARKGRSNFFFPNAK